MQKKVIIGRFQHETNSFCSKLGDETMFRNLCFDVGACILKNQKGVGSEIGAFIDVFENRDDIVLLPTVDFVANPTGPVTGDVFDYALREILSAIEKNAPVDGVLLALHGAMVAVGHPDGEGDLLEEIRTAVGADVPIIVSLDLHSNTTKKMAENATALIPYECYPHTDTYKTGLRAAHMMQDTLDGKIHPQMAFRLVPYLLPLFPSEEPEMKCIYDKTAEMKKTKGVLFPGFCHGFFAADIEEMGMGITIVTDGDRPLAEEMADELFVFISERTPTLKRTFPTLDAVLEKALSSDKPFVIADASDNPGTGAFSDSTHILREILKRGIRDAILATIVDPESVTKCEAAGVGSTVRLALGGKSDPRFSGGPLDVTAYVKMISDGKYVAKAKIAPGEIIKHGKTAVVEIEGNTVLIASIPRQPWDTEVFYSHGIRPEEHKIIITKSAVHYRAAYGEITDRLEAVALPGIANPVPDGYPFQNWK